MIALLTKALDGSHRSGFENWRARFRCRPPGQPLCHSNCSRHSTLYHLRAAGGTLTLRRPEVHTVNGRLIWPLSGGLCISR